jgi:putative membrane protein
VAGEWQRLHPLSPLVRAGRGLIAIVVLLIIPTSGGKGSSNTQSALIHGGILVLLLLFGLVSWLVTRWRLEGGVLHVESGLLRRTSDRVPLTQVQAIDIIRPGLARLFGLAELRLRLASGGRKAGRLAYLSLAGAEALRAQLLALSRGETLDAPATAPERERPLLFVPPGRLVASLALTTAGLVFELVVAGFVALAVLAPSAFLPALGASAPFLFGFVAGWYRRVNGDYRFTLTEASDGWHMRAGLVETSAETIPRGRVQALRMVEPIAWQPLGWCRVEVDVARQKSKGSQDRSGSRSTKALLPVGPRADAEALLARVFPGLPTERLTPPRRARWKSPLRYRRLAYGSNDTYVMATSGRLNRVCVWVPLEKVQSIRRVEGPLQRRLALATIHLDVAGRRLHAALRDRDHDEAARLMTELPDRCRAARRATERAVASARP